MKLLIVSDSHGNFGALQKIIRSEMPFDRLIHLGDGLEEAYHLRQVFPFILDGVAGNNDPPDLAPESLTLRLEKQICFFTHGHLFNVHYNLDAAIKAARSERAAFLFFGHTHEPLDRTKRGLRIINPGSICPHLSASPGYLIWEAEKDKVRIERKAI